MEMMDYQQCLEYVMENKLKTYHDSDSGVWTVSNAEGRSAQAPDYKAAIDSWKALHNAADRQGDD